MRKSRRCLEVGLCPQVGDCRRGRATKLPSQPALGQSLPPGHEASSVFLSEFSSFTWGRDSGFPASGSLWSGFLKEKGVWEERTTTTTTTFLHVKRRFLEENDWGSQISRGSHLFPGGILRCARDPKVWPDAELSLPAVTKHSPQSQTWPRSSGDQY